MESPRNVYQKTETEISLPTSKNQNKFRSNTEMFNKTSKVTFSAKYKDNDIFKDKPYVNN